MRSSRRAVVAGGLLTAAGCAAPDPIPAPPPSATAADRARAANLYREALRTLGGPDRSGDADRAAALLLEAAELGHPEAQEVLGRLLLDTSDPARRARGVMWTTRAAMAGRQAAARRLAQLYQAGDGVVRDDAWSVVWLERAAERGDPAAQHALGLRQVVGEGTAEDRVAALAWLTRAAAGGISQSVRYRDALAASLSAEQAAEARRIAAAPLVAGPVRGPDRPLVRFVQSGLRRLGREDLVVDGRDGPQTRSALTAWAREAGVLAGAPYSAATIEGLRARLRG